MLGSWFGSCNKWTTRWARNRLESLWKHELTKVVTSIIQSNILLFECFVELKLLSAQITWNQIDMFVSIFRSMAHKVHDLAIERVHCHLKRLDRAKKISVTIPNVPQPFQMFLWRAGFVILQPPNSQLYSGINDIHERPARDWAGFLINGGLKIRQLYNTVMLVFFSGLSIEIMSYNDSSLNA